MIQPFTHMLVNNSKIAEIRICKPSTFMLRYIYCLPSLGFLWYKPPHDKTNKIACAPSEDSDQPRRSPSLISVFAVRRKKPWVFNYLLNAQWRLWSDWADAQADLSLRWAHSHFDGFVMRLLIYKPSHDKTNEMACALSEASDQPGHPPSLVRVYAQADLSLRCPHGERLDR